MADTGRVSHTTPDSALHKIGSTVSGIFEAAASSVKPQSEKPITQQAGDAVSGNSNETMNSMADKAKETAYDAKSATHSMADKAKETVSDAKKATNSMADKAKETASDAKKAMTGEK